MLQPTQDQHKVVIQCQDKTPFEYTITDAALNKKLQRKYADFDAIPDQALTQEILMHTGHPIVDEDIYYQEDISNINYYPYSSKQGGYQKDAQCQIMDVSADHFLHKKSKVHLGIQTVPEIVSRAPKQMAILSPLEEAELKRKLVGHTVAAITPKNHFQTMRDADEKFNFEHDTKIDWISDSRKGIRLASTTSGIFESEIPLDKGRQVIARITHQPSQREIVLTMVPFPEKPNHFRFATAILGEMPQDAELYQKLESLGESLANITWNVCQNHLIPCGLVKANAKQGSGLASKFEPTQASHAEPKFLPIRIGTLVSEIADAWSAKNPRFSWKTARYAENMTIFKLRPEHMNNPDHRMGTQITIGARNKQLHHSVLIDRVLSETQMPYYYKNRLKRYTQDGIVSDAFCQELIEHPIFKDAFETHQKAMGKQPKPYDAVKFADLKGAMNILFHQYVGLQIKSFRQLKNVGSSKNNAIFLLKSTPREMFTSNMRTEESHALYALYALYAQAPDWFKTRLVDHLSNHMETLQAKGDTLWSKLPLTVDSNLDDNFEDNYSSESIGKHLDDIFSQKSQLDKSAITERRASYSGTTDNDPAFTNALSRNGKSYTTLGNRTLIEQRWPVILSAEPAPAASLRYLNRTAPNSA